MDNIGGGKYGTKSAIVADLSPTVLYELAAPSTPETVQTLVEKQLRKWVLGTIGHFDRAEQLQKMPALQSTTFFVLCATTTYAWIVSCCRFAKLPNNSIVCSFPLGTFGQICPRILGFACLFRCLPLCLLGGCATTMLIIARLNGSLNDRRLLIIKYAVQVAIFQHFSQSPKRGSVLISNLLGVVLLSYLEPNWACRLDSLSMITLTMIK